MKLKSVLLGVCTAAMVFCASLPVWATAPADLVEPIVVATEPDEVDSKIYYYQNERKVSPDTFTWKKGKNGNAVLLNGEDQYLRYSAEKTLQLEEFTFSGWINWQGNGETIGQKLLTVYKNDNRFITVSPHLRDEERGIDGVYMEWQDRMIDPVALYNKSTNQTTFALETNAWHHVAVVAADDEFSLYIDGTLQFTQVMDVSLEDMELNTFLIGGGFYGEPLLHALLDDAYLYPQALDKADVALLAAGLDPADGGTPPTTETYRPTMPTTAPSKQPADGNMPHRGTLFGLPAAVLIIPAIIFAVVIALSVILSLQKKRTSEEEPDPSPFMYSAIPFDPEESAAEQPNEKDKEGDQE